jgi:pterin-4a-carbinolamine dehydratase
MQLPEGYIDSQGALERTFELPSFRDAIAFVGRVADLAEEANHHPDITISYKQTLTTSWRRGRMRSSSHSRALSPAGLG